MSSTDGEQDPIKQLVVIGSSAGGIDALSRLVATLPADFPAPLVIAQHLDPKRESMLDSILGRHTTLPVRSARNRQVLAPGTIYVVPADRHVAIADGEIAPIEDGGDRPVPSINFLFETAARAYGEGLIAVILTGTGTDGALGAYSVRGAGGTIVVQNPETAAYPGMPRSLAPTMIDVIADLEQIGPILHRLLSGEQVPPRPGETPALSSILADLSTFHGVDFSNYKLPTIRRRLQRRIAATGTETIEGYTRYLARRPEEYQQLLASLLIKVTTFFRDPELFAYLRDTILPELLDYGRQHGRDLRIWSAGCATGEEAYSLAILVADALGDELEDWKIRIFATDLDPDAVAFARQGLYAAKAVDGLPEELIARAFTPEEGGFQIRKRLRALMVFGQHDLAQRAPFPRCDLVLCRNVLIYFTPELQQRALHLFAYSLRRGGFLLLGKGESVSALTESFSAENGPLRIYRRAGEFVLIPPARLRYLAPLAPLPPRHLPASPRLAPPGAPPQEQRRPVMRDELSLQGLPIGIVRIDRHYDILAINAAARDYLAIPSIAIGDDLVHLAQGIPHSQVREAIDEALRTGITTSVEPFLTEDVLSPKQRYLQLTCYPQGAPAARGRYETAVIAIIDVTAATQTQQTRARAQRTADTAAGAASDREVQSLQQQVERLVKANQQLMAANEELLADNAELRTANENYLVGLEEAQASTEEIETLNEEMQATNEELETLNEEMQATVEELNTTNEEMQATVEELNTTNDELQATVEELNTTNDELQARSVELQESARGNETERARLAVILQTMSDAVLVVQRNGTRVVTNPAYQHLFDQANVTLLITDVNGLPLPPGYTPEERAARGETFSMEFTTTDPRGNRRWFEAVGRPITDPEGHMQWGIVVIRDITDRSLHRLQDQFLALASHELRTPLTSLQGYLQMVAMQLETEPDRTRVQNYIGNAIRQVARLGRIVNDLVDASRLQHEQYSFALRPVWLDEVVAQAVAIAQPLASDQAIRLDAADGHVRVQGDAGRLEQVLLNLLTNAMTYAAGTSVIDVRLRRVGQEAELQVQDRGPGIPSADLPHLFTRFYQASGVQTGPRRGLGLGLFIAREIVTAHSGTIGVDSAEGAGTTFTIRLPLLSEAEPAE